mmetsp:Transcript_2980/g.6762  ORF Transcript_2980/g.6762 Transcript_2980/m.6762 type:complete len:274 (+) Transcript_2980:275-1096(+)
MAHADPGHGDSEILRHFSQLFRVVEMSDCLHNCSGTLLGVLRLEDSTANKHTVDTKLHAQSSICGGGDPASCEIHNRQSAELLDFLHQIYRSIYVLGKCEYFSVVEVHELLNLPLHSSNVFNSSQHISCSSFAFGTNHRSAFRNSSQSLPQIAAAADKRNLEWILVDVVFFVCNRQHFGFVNVIDFDCFKNLRLDKMTNAALGHYRNRHRLLDGFDHLGVGHSRYSAILSDVSRNFLKRHHSAGARFFSDASLLRVHHIHDYTTFQHLREALL